MPSDYDASDDMCSQCKITIKLIYNGHSWLGYGVSRDGGMVGSTVVIGSPSEDQPTLYELEGKVAMRDWFTAGLNLDNSSIKYDNENAQTIMEFTAPFNTFFVTDEENAYREQGLSLKSPTYFIYAHGNEGNMEPGYHGVNNKGYRQLENMINPDTASFVDDGKDSVTEARVMDQNEATKNANLKIITFWCACVAISATAM